MRPSAHALLTLTFAIVAGALSAPDAAGQAITVTPAGSTISFGQTVQFTASGVDPAGAIEAGAFHQCALLQDATVRCWGLNDYGQLGNGTISNPADTPTPIPVAVVGLSGAAAISAGAFHTCARLPNGTLRCWGRNSEGQLGNPATTAYFSATPVPVAAITGATAVTGGGFHTCALSASGSVRCWGLNDFGQLGNGLVSTAANPTPATVVGITTAVAISAGGWHTCALLSNGRVRCWGDNERGQVGDGTPVPTNPFVRRPTPTPVEVVGITTAVALRSGIFHTCALLLDGRVQCWGWNTFGQLGNDPPSSNASSTPVTVSGAASPLVLAPGAEHTCLLLQDRTVRCWGDNIFGQLGNGSPRGTGPMNPGDSAPVTGITAATGLTSGAEHSCALLPGGTVGCWGRGLFGRLGDGSTSGEDAFTPVGVVGLGARWSSSNTAVATIDAAGLATGRNAGSTTITATSGSRSGSTTLTVTGGPPPTRFLLSVTRQGSGGGTVTSSPAGISCGSACSALYDQGTLVTLTAVAATGSAFNGWNGCDSVSAGACAVAMNAARAVTATFVSSATGLVVAYAFSEGGGSTTADASGNNRTGTISGAAWTTQGRFGNALSFDGANSRVTAGQVQLGSSFTMMAWVFNPTNTAYETIATVGSSRDLYLQDGVIGFYDGATERAFGSPVASNAWQHVALVHDGASLRAYLNGVPQGAPQAAALPAVTGTLQIGALLYNASNWDFFGGRIDEVRVYSRALTQAEVQQAMNTSLGP